MDAFFARNRLSAYLDGALDDAEAAKVASAIERDPTLKAEYEALRQVVEILRDDGPVQAPEGFHARLMAKVDEEPAPGGVVVFLRRTFGRVPVEAVALAAAALVVVIVIQGQPGQETASQPKVVSADRSSANGTPGGAATPVAASESSKPPAKVPAPVEELAKAEPPPSKAASRSDLKKVGYGAATPASAAASAGKGSYVPAWDQDDPDDIRQAEASKSAANDVVAATPEAWRMSLSHASSLFDLAGIADQLGGQLRDDKGGSLVPRALNAEDNYARVHLVVPVAQREAVIARLRKMQAVPAQLSGNTPMYGANQAGFVIDVQYMQ